MSPVWVAFVAACSALMASIVGPFVTLAISRRQFRANVVSANREKWIGTLRETVAEFISLGAAASIRAASEAAPGHARVQADPALLPRFERGSCSIRPSRAMWPSSARSMRSPPTSSPEPPILWPCSRRWTRSRPPRRS